MMSSSRGGDALSLRLNTLQSFYSEQKHVWDIGCDHGLLGLSLIANEAVEKVHLVDPSLAVIKELEDKLKDSYITKGKLVIHHQEGQQVFTDPTSNCIFIAGMGGKEIGEIILHLLPQLNSSSRIVISPHRKILELRSLLKELPLTLEKEVLVLEDQQYYQILSLVPDASGRKVSLFGEYIWEGEWGKSYQEHQLNFFQKHRDEASRNYVHYLQKLKLLKINPKEKL